MKKITAIIKPFREAAVSEALDAIEGIDSVVVSRVKDCFPGSIYTEMYRGHEYAVDLVPRVKFEVAVDDSMVGSVAEAIRTAAHTGIRDDGKIRIESIDQYVDILTGNVFEQNLQRPSRVITPSVAGAKAPKVS